MIKLKSGSTFPNIQLTDTNGQGLTLPNSESTFTHIQFRRFAGCPVCNTHLQALKRAADEITKAGIKEIIFFHSTTEALRPHIQDFPFTFIADPDKKYYKQFGVESSWGSLLHPKTALAALTGLRPSNLVAALSPEENHLGYPADFLIDAKGKVMAAKYGKHAADGWTLDELLAQCKP